MPDESPKDVKENKDVKEPKEDKYQIEPEAPPITTEHHITIKGKKLSYTATVGMMPMRNDLGEVEAGMGYTAYTVKSDTRRPVTFTFNGGPGSASVWLHLGAVGPKRVALGDQGMAPPPPHKLVDNEETWLQFSDLVFIDPIGTGFSRPVKKEDEKKFWGLKGDVESVGKFVLNYLSLYGQWLSPVFIAGESYGTTRAAALSDYLYTYGVAINGIVLVSSILNFQTARFTKGNDLPFSLFLPTYAATAWFHKKVPADLQKKSLATFLAEVEKFVEDEYIPSLQAGNKVPETKRKAIAKKLGQYCGLDPNYVELSDIRIEIHRFCKELLRDERRTVGRLDSRYKGIDGSQVAETPEHDPSNSAIGPVFASTMNDYVRESLGYKPTLYYNIFAPGELYKIWDWGDKVGHPDTAESLRSTMSKNPFMKIFVASGYYDLATPYYATQYTLAHMGLDESVRGNITCKYYEAGHMMYVKADELSQLRKDVEAFYSSALKK